MRPLFLCTAAACSLLMGVLSASVQAKEVPSLSPTSGWAVNRITDAAGASGPYCALAREYENGTVVSLGRNTDGEYSLAVDFQKDRFDTGRAYSIMVQPAPGQARAFELAAATNRAMVVRLGRDSGFFQALQSSQNLKVDISGTAYTFSMPDIARGESDLQACVGSLQPGGAKTAARPAPEQPEVQKAGIQKTDTQKPDSLPSATAATLNRDVLNQDLLNADAGSVSGDFSARKLSVPGRVSRSRHSPVSLEEENKRLKTALEEERQRYETALTQGVESNKVAEMEEKVRLLEKENRALQARSSAPAPVPAARPSPSVPQLEPDTAQIAGLEQKIRKIETENTALRQTIRTLETDVEKEKSRPDYAQALQTVRGELAAAQQDNDKLRGDLQKAQVQKDEADAIKTAARVSKAPESPAVPLQCASDEKLDRLQNTLDRERKSCQDEKAVLERALYEKKPSPKAATVETGQIAQLENELQKARAALARQSREGDQQRAKPETGKAGSDKAALEQEIKNLTRQLADLQNRQEKLLNVNARVKGEADKMRVQLANAQAQDVSRPDRLAALRMQIEKLNNRLSLKENEARTYKTQLAALRREMSLNNTPPASGVAQGVKRQAARPVTQVAAPAQRRQSSGSFMDRLKQIISGARLDLSDRVRRVPSQGQAELYNWKAGLLHGRAEIVPIADMSVANRFIAEHIEQAKRRCSGDFASVESNRAGGKSYYEMACVSTVGSTSASILFFVQGGRFVTISHETAAENMDVAMDTRDRVAAQVR